MIASSTRPWRVLILVLVEDSLRGGCMYATLIRLSVLILVLVEDSLRALKSYNYNDSDSRLNPCFSGR